MCDDFIVALRLHRGRYVINDNWAIQASGDYSAAGAVFQYYRPSDTTGREHILCVGPVNHTIDIMVNFVLRKA